MRAVLQAISEELARLKAEGEQVVPVSEEALAGLRALVRARSEAAGIAPVESVANRPASQSRDASVPPSAAPAARREFAPPAAAPAPAASPTWPSTARRLR